MPDESTPMFVAGKPRQFDDGNMNTMVDRDQSFDPSKESQRMIQEAIELEQAADQHGKNILNEVNNTKNASNDLLGVKDIYEQDSTVNESAQDASGSEDSTSDSNTDTSDDDENEEGELEVSEESEPDEPYLVRGALLHCRKGSHDRRLNLPLCHGVYSTQHPLITRLDCLPGDDQNIPTFGVCSSGKNPSKDEIVLEGYVPVNVHGERSGEADSTVKGKPCSPVIVGTWLLTEDKNRIVDNGQKDSGDRKLGRAFAKGQPMVTMKSFLVCKYGGLIEPMLCGQEYINPKEQHSIIGEDEPEDEACEVEGVHEH